MESTQVSGIYIIMKNVSFNTIVKQGIFKTLFEPIFRRELSYGRRGTVRNFGQRVSSINHGYLEEEEGSWFVFETLTKLWSFLPLLLFINMAVLKRPKQKIFLRSREVLEDLDLKRKNTQRMELELMTQISKEVVSM